MGAFRDLSKETFGRLVPQRTVGKSKCGNYLWECVCTGGGPDCKGTVVVKGGNLAKGMSTSCGCYRNDRIREVCMTHGDTHKPEYNIWSSMIQRCTDPNIDCYAGYGGRGITVCDRWLNSYEAFLEDMGRRPGPDMQLDRRDNDAGYSKANCRWVTRKVNCRNRRDNVFYTFGGESLTLSEWSDRTGIGRSTLRARIEQGGWSVERALTSPV